MKLSSGALHSDDNKHILMFDIIYCCKVYDLFGSISFERPNTKEKKLLVEFKEKAVALKSAYDEAKETAAMLEDAVEYFSTAVKIGDTVSHRKNGNGVVRQISLQYIDIEFSAEIGMKRLSLPVVIANGIVKYNVADFDENVAKYKAVLLKYQDIPKHLERTAKALEEYEEYLD